MKSILQQIAKKNRLQEVKDSEAINEEITNPKTNNDRRNFLKKAAFGGIALGGLINLSIEDTIAQVTSKVTRASSPSDLKITDLRVAEKGKGSTTEMYDGFMRRILRIDTNQGIYGIGDMRDGTDQRFGLFLKSKIVGINPCNVEMIFKVIKQYGGHGRQGGGVSAVEMALWDICGKALGVPVWQLLGGRYRDKIRLYADTPMPEDPKVQLANLKHRLEVQGYTWLKMDLGIVTLNNKTPGLITNTRFWNEHGLNSGHGDYREYMGYANTEHPFTQIQITDKGLDAMAAVVENVRNAIGMEIPVSVDHFGFLDENQMIRIGRALDKYRLAWLEDMVPWFYTEKLVDIRKAIETPICTGEDIYMLGGMLGGFKNLIDANAVDIVQPDLVSAGGILETKKIGDYAEEKGIPMAMHHASSPVAFMANVHCAAATENFLALEHHNVDNPWWEGLVKMTGSLPLITKGYGNVPLDAPGLGIELNDENVKAQLSKGKSYFDPTPEWDSTGPTYDKLWI
jgi:L-alanine-DL-glutamate epimerase-like enolase superfamily enzyme